MAPSSVELRGKYKMYTHTHTPTCLKHLPSISVHQVCCKPHPCLAAVMIFHLISDNPLSPLHNNSKLKLSTFTSTSKPSFFFKANRRIYWSIYILVNYLICLKLYYCFY